MLDSRQGKRCTVCLLPLPAMRRCAAANLYQVHNMVRQVMQGSCFNQISLLRLQIPPYMELVVLLKDATTSRSLQLCKFHPRNIRLSVASSALGLCPAYLGCMPQSPVVSMRLLAREHPSSPCSQLSLERTSAYHAPRLLA